MNLSTRLMIAMIALVLCTAAANLIGYHSVESTVVPGALQRLETQARARLGVLDIYLSGFRADVLAMRAVPSHDALVRTVQAGGVDPVGGTPTAVWLDRIEIIYRAQLQAKPAIQQFRLIGIADGGRELVRIDRSGPDNTPRVVPREELRPRGDRDYFLESVNLPPGQVYISPIQFSQAGGPANMPVMRFATPLTDAAGKPFAIVIINLDVGPIFARIRATMNQDSLIYLVNADGDLLLHPEAGRDFDPGRRYRWQDELPGLAKLVGPGGNGAAIVTNASGEKVVAALATAQVAGGPTLGVIETDAFATLMAPATETRRQDLIAGLVAVGIAILLTVILVRSLTRPLVAITKAVQKFGRGEPMRLPVNAAGEAGILAAAFAQMTSEVNEKNAALQKKTELLDKTIDSIADAVLMIDADGKLVFANAVCRRMFGDPGDRAEDLRVPAERFRSDEITPMPAFETPIGRALRGENFDNIEVAFVRNGESRPTHVSASGRIVTDAAGRREGAVIVYHDLTTFRETEHQLRQAQKMEAVGQLTGGVAHDFNNILTVITGGIEMITEGVADRPDLAKLAEMIDQAVDRGSQLTHQLLSFARRQPLQPRRVDVNVLVEDAARLLRPTLGEQIEIETRMVAEPWSALADPVQLGNALINLAINARDAMPSGGKLIFETANVFLDEDYAAQNAELAPGPYVMVAVSDNGCGMAPAVRDRVFDPFFTTKPVGKGTGLGLSMVYGFVRQSDGHIKIYSEQGVGTTMKIYLPRAVGVVDKISPETAPDVIGGHETVLVVEDDELVRQYVMTNLAALGYKAVAAASGAEALALAARSPPFDLLLTDVVLGAGVSGRNLAEELVRRQPSLRVLYTSGYTEDAIVHHGRLDPGLHLLTKPYRSSELARMIRLVMSDKHAKVVATSGSAATS